MVGLLFIQNIYAQNIPNFRFANPYQSNALLGLPEDDQTQKLSGFIKYASYADIRKGIKNFSFKFILTDSSRKRLPSIGIIGRSYKEGEHIGFSQLQIHLQKSITLNKYLTATLATQQGLASYNLGAQLQGSGGSDTHYDFNIGIGIKYKKTTLLNGLTHINNAKYQPISSIFSLRNEYISRLSQEIILNHKNNLTFFIQNNYHINGKENLISINTHIGIFEYLKIQCGINQNFESYTGISIESIKSSIGQLKFCFSYAYSLKYQYQYLNNRYELMTSFGEKYYP